MVAGEGEPSDDVVALSPGRVARGSSGKAVASPGATAASSFPGGGFDLSAVKASSVPASGLTTVSVVNLPPGIVGMLVFVLYSWTFFFFLFPFVFVLLWFLLDEIVR